MVRIRILGTGFVAAIMLLATHASAANLLTNPGFETGDLTGWNNNGGGNNEVSVGAPTAGAHQGNSALRLNALADGVPEANQGAFGGPGPVFAASPGDEFNFSAYMLTEAALPGGATFGLLKIVFEDADGNDLLPESASKGIINSSEFPGIESQPFLNDSSATDTWIFTEAQGVAPAGTTSVQFLALNVDFGNGANHPMWFDTISAELVPEPGTFTLIGLALAGLLVWRRRS